MKTIPHRPATPCTEVSLEYGSERGAGLPRRKRPRSSRTRTPGFRHLSRTRLIVAAVAVLAAAAGSPAVAQKTRFEVTPYYGHTFFGGFEIDDHEFGRLDLELDNTDVQGLAFGFPIGRRTHLELFWAEQDTRFGLDDGLFLPSVDLGGMDVTYYHAGVSWTAPIGQVRPFFVLSGGITELDPNGNFLLDDESLLSVGLGGGIKIFWTEHIGLRLEARLLATKTGDEDLCCHDCCYQEEREDLLQGFVTAGFIFAF